MNEVEWAQERFGVFDYVPVGVFVLRADMAVLFWNSCLEDWTGIARGQIVGANIGDHFPHLIQPKYLARLQTIFEGGPPTIFSSHLHKYIIPSFLPDGQVRIQHTTVTAAPAADGGGFHALFSLQDVTDLTRRIQDYRVMHAQALEEVAERKRAEEALRQSETLNRAVSENLRQRNLDMALLNRLGQELTATLDLPQIIKRLLEAVTEVVDAEDASAWLWDKQQAGWLVCQTILRAQQGSTLHLRLSPGQGVAGWVAQTGQSAAVPCAPEDVRFFPGIDKQINFNTRSLLAVPLWVRGKVIGVLEVVNKLEGDFDEDDRVLAETLAASAAIALDNAELVEALRQQAAELQARNEELDAFAHTAAHDLKGPLGYMVGFARVLEEDYTVMPPEKLCEHLHTIARNGRKMVNIVDELLLLASVRKVEKVELKPLDMARIVAEALGRLDDLTKKYRAEIAPPETWPVALGHAPWVEEVWVNYISNAIRYGGQAPRVGLGATPLFTSPSQAGDGGGGGYVRFWVCDNGPGLSPEEQSRLFVPFSRLDEVRVSGYGLGLSIVKRIVEKLGGQVGVDSKVGVGSVFWFTLPAA